ncbi:hypothetical protein T492DRAFT_1144226 [Pavlovales sp. CCMP2436]|nr:hypothetical protein T492DRAFT_1144226 [Pavlovales sp. CCMP2436]
MSPSRHEMKKRVRLGVDESASTLAVPYHNGPSMSQSGPNTTRALANARAPRIRRQTPSASVSPAFVRPANYRRMPARMPALTPARNPRTQPVQAGPAFVRPAHYRRMQDRMEMPARIEMLGDIFLDVFNTPPPRINRGNLFTSVGPPDKNFRLPTSSAGMDRLYNQLMLQGRKIDRVFSETHPQIPLHRTLNTYMAKFKEKDIDVDHQGAVRYIAKAADSKWKSLDLTGPQRPILDKGLRSYGTFLRSARITVNRPSDLETPILDCRFSPEEFNANEENQQAHLASEMARHDATGSAISPPENDPFWMEADSWRTVFSSADTLVTFTQVVNITSGGSSSLADMRIATPKTIEYDTESIADTAESIADSDDNEPIEDPPEPMINCLIDIIRSRFTARIDEIENERSALPVGKTGRPKKGEMYFRIFIFAKITVLSSTRVPRGSSFSARWCAMHILVAFSSVMCVNTDLQRILEINAVIIVRGKAHKSVKVLLFEKYMYGDVFVIGHHNGKFILEGSIIDPITNVVRENLRFEADEKRTRIIMEPFSDYCDEEVIEKGPTPEVIKQLMRMQSQHRNPWF